MTRLKLAELTSGVGGLVLGIGLGALFSTWIAPAAGFVTLAGLLTHAFGMWDKHRLEARTPADSGPLGYNAFAIPLAAGVLARQGILLPPAFAAVLMSASTVIVAINAQLLRRARLSARGILES